uniref:alpha-N-acetylgalactosaminide alpha-2,6-sialyltransferase n=1 Tax=Lepisosteus oculatus TaxID=7918 RepID=W5MZT1_LEPOC|nr:PREDICTED: alpha-N-acetylgalactosaminide alpha-2,6-sialyltransferase 2-like isoform X1 [Lepisosteus oculatus]
MPNCRWKCVFVLGAAFFTFSTFIYGHYYELDFLFHFGNDLQQRGYQGQVTDEDVKEGLDSRMLVKPTPAQRTITHRNFVLQEEEETKTRQEKEVTCSLRWSIHQHPKLHNLFNFSVPVLQWASSFSPSEWQRLQQHLPPYGWKGLPVEVVNSTLALLGEEANRDVFPVRPQGGCVRCAVVGNGGILNGSRQGHAIDSHDFVFRINGAITKGFEEDVGTKTSFYGFTTNTMKNSLIAYRAFGFDKVPQEQDIQYIFIPSDVRDYVMLSSAIRSLQVPWGHDRGDLPSKYFGSHSLAKDFKMLHPDFIRYIKDRFLKSRLLKMTYSHLYMPSTGALMLLTALHSCDQVSAYGFITENYVDFSDHYFDVVKKPLVFYANHDMQLEAQVWKLLDSLQVLQLYKRAAPLPMATAG